MRTFVIAALLAGAILPVVGAHTAEAGRSGRYGRAQRLRADQWPVRFLRQHLVPAERGVVHAQSQRRLAAEHPQEAALPQAVVELRVVSLPA